MKTAAKLLVAAAGAAGLTAASAGVLPKLVLQAATAREEPKLIRGIRARQVRNYCNSAQHADAAAAGLRLRDAAAEQVEITAHDGIRLVGHWVPCENANRIVIAVHGWRSSWYGDFGACAEYLRENGCSVLYVEQRGQGASGGAYLGFGLLERYDCVSWADYIFRTYGQTLPVYLAGISMGATSVLLAAELPLPPNIHGIIADCGFSSAESIWQHVTESTAHIPYRLIKHRVDALCQKRFGCLPGEVTTEKALRNCKIPILLFHGGKDDFVPPQMSEAAKKACAGDCQLLIVPDAKHGESFLKAPEEYQAMEKAFWQKYD